MKQKFRLIFGQKMEAPLANSKLMMVFAAVLMLAGTGIFWKDAADTCFLTRERAQAVDVTVREVTVTGEGGYVPRMEIAAEDGKTYALMEKQAGSFFSRARNEIQAGDALTLRLSRHGSVMEVQEGDDIWVPFGTSMNSGRVGRIINLAAGGVFALLSVVLLLRAAALWMNGREKFRFGPAR